MGAVAILSWAGCPGLAEDCEEAFTKAEVWLFGLLAVVLISALSLVGMVVLACNKCGETPQLVDCMCRWSPPRPVCTSCPKSWEEDEPRGSLVEDDGATPFGALA